MICPRCGADTKGVELCGNCGAQLPWRCSRCGGENPPGKRFCGDCGASAGEPAEAPRPAQAPSATSTAERRQLTIMFADLVGSTALGGRLDPEDLRDVISSYRGCVIGGVNRFDGFVARHMGDGVLAYFGYPQAHEDDAERAIRAGLAVTEAVRRLATVAGPAGTLAARVGIATGLTVVGDLISSGASPESSAVGGTSKLAPGLQAVAEPGGVVIADATRRLAGELFDYRDLGPMRLRGLNTPVHAWAVLGESTVESRFRALRPDQVPLVGRSEEIELLLRRWEQASSGEGRVVLLTGEPGIGKSRLIAALEQRLLDEAHEVVRLFCSPHNQDTPLHPVIRQLERVAQLKRDDPPQTRLEKLKSSLPMGSCPDSDIAVLADLLSIPGAPESLPDTLTAPQRKEMTFSAIARQFEWLARTRPLLAVIEDIHWADPTTHDFLSFLIERLDGWPMLLVVTARPGLQPLWASRSHATVQLLNSFNRRDASALVKEVSSRAPLPDHVVERIVAHCDGVPLFIEEMTKTVLEREATRPGDDVLSRFEPLAGEAVPISLQALLMTRLDALASGKEIAQIGSVIGRDFTFEMLERLSGWPSQRLEQTLDELVLAGLIGARGEPPDATYTFKHGLVQDAAYASLLRDRRRAIHLRVAQMLEKDLASPIAVTPQVLAWRFAEAGIPDKSIAYYLKAAEHTTGRFAFAEMVSQLRKGLQQLQYLPDSTETQRRELALRTALGRALIDYRGSGSEEVRQAFERARELCLALGETKQLLPIYDGLVLNYYFANSQPAKMLGYATELFELGESTGDAQASLWARRARGSANLLLGRFEEARAEMQFVTDTYRKSGSKAVDPRMARDPRVSTYTLFGICLTALGYPDIGAAMSSQGLDHAERLNHVVSLNTGLRRVSVQRIMQRDTRDVLDLSTRLLALNAEHETFVGVREGMVFRGWAQLQQKSDQELLSRVRICLDELDAARHWVMLPFLMVSIAEVIGNGQDRADALSLLDRAAELVRITGEQWCEPEIIRLRARFGASDPDEAAFLLREALAKAREQGAKLWELRAAVTLVEIQRDLGKHDAGHETLAPIYGWFTEGFDTPDLIAARTLLPAPVKA